MPVQEHHARTAEATDAPPALSAVAAPAYPASGLDVRLGALGVPADVLADVRRQAREDGVGMVDLLVQKRVLPEAELLKAVGAEYCIAFWEELPTDHMSTGFTALVSIQYLKKQKIVPLETPQGFVVALNDPANFQAVDDLEIQIGRAHV